MLTHHDWSSLTATGLSLMPTGLSDVRCRLHLPLSVARRQLTSLRSFSPLSTGVPFLPPVTSRSRVQTLCLVSRDSLLGGPPTSCHKLMVFHWSWNDSKSSHYSGWSQLCCSLDGLHLSYYFLDLQSLYQSFGDCIKSTNFNYYYFCYSFRVFHNSVSWWSFTGVWTTASLLKSPGLFSVF